MKMEYKEKLDRMIDSMKKRRLDKVADELLNIKEAIGELGPIVPEGIHRRRGLLRRSPDKEPHEVVPGDLGQKGFEKGDIYTELGPGTETQKLWGTPKHKVRTIQRFIDDQKSGILQAEHLLEDYVNESDPNKKALYYENLKKVLSNYKAMGSRLSYVKEALDKKGYETLAKRVGLICDLIWRGASMEEKHELPSIEAVYEKSSSPGEFDENLKKLVKVYEYLAMMVKKFESEYKSKVIDRASLEKDSEKDITEKTVDLVRKSDHAIYAKVNSMLREME